MDGPAVSRIVTTKVGFAGSMSLVYYIADADLASGRSA